LEQKSADELITLIKTQASMRKANKYDLAVFQTTDLQSSSHIHDKMKAG